MKIEKIAGELEFIHVPDQGILVAEQRASHFETINGFLDHGFIVMQ